MPNVYFLHFNMISSSNVSSALPLKYIDPCFIWKKALVYLEGGILNFLTANVHYYPQNCLWLTMLFFHAYNNPSEYPLTIISFTVSIIKYSLSFTYFISIFWPHYIMRDNKFFEKMEFQTVARTVNHNSCQSKQALFSIEWQITWVSILNIS